MLNLVNLSGGKDSTAMLLLMLEKNIPVDHIIFSDTGMDYPEMHEHFKELEAYLQKEFPLTAPPITVLEPKKSFYFLMFEHIKTKGKNKGSRGYGWPTFRCRWCTSQLKSQILNNYGKDLKQPHRHFIGFALDEPKRCKAHPDRVYPLASNWKYTEQEALDCCFEHGFQWSGLYKKFFRASCWCCPLQSLSDLEQLYLHYRDKWEELKEMERNTWNRFRLDYTFEELEERFEHSNKVIQTTLF